MAVTTTLTPFPNPAPNIQTQSQEVFSQNADSAFSHLITEFPDINAVGDEINSTAVEVNDNAVIATNKAAIATTQAGIATTQATASAASAASALSSLNEFKGQYYGSLASEPTTDPLGNAMGKGDLYYNSTTNEINSFDGVVWSVPKFGATAGFRNEEFTATAGQTVFTVAGGYSPESASVFKNGAKLLAADVDLSSGTTFTLATADAVAGDRFEFLGFGSFDVATTAELTTSTTDTTIGRVPKNGDTGLGFTAVAYLAGDFASVTWNQVTDTYSGSPKAVQAHSNMRRCVQTSDGVVQYYLDPFNSDLKEDGTASDLTGTDGDVMVEIPQTWVRTDFDGDEITWAVSHKPASGFVLHPRFRGGAVDKVYVGAYDASVFDTSAGVHIDGLNLDNNLARVDLVNDRLASVSGKYPMVGLKRSDFRALAGNAGGYVEAWWEWQLLQILYITEHGNWNSQATIGDGNVSRSYSASSDIQTDSPHVIAGLSNGLGNASGAGVEPNPFVSYRGVENLWGNCWTMIDGINLSERLSYVSDTPANFADDTAVNYTSIGVALPVSSTDYIKTWQGVDNVFLPSIVGGTSSSFIGDGLWTNTGWRTEVVGGLASDGATAGIAACRGSYSSANLSRGHGSRLSREKLI